MDNLKYIVGLIFKMLKAKELGVVEDEIKVPTHPRESEKETKEAKKESIDKDIP